MNNMYANLIIVTAFFSAVSQILLNLANQKEYGLKSKLFEYLNPYVISSYLILILVLVTNIYIMKFVPLKIAHILAASSYMFVMFLSHFILKEKLTIKKITGNILIIISIIIFIQ